MILIEETEGSRERERKKDSFGRKIDFIEMGEAGLFVGHGCSLPIQRIILFLPVLVFLFLPSFHPTLCFLFAGTSI